MNNMYYKAGKFFLVAFLATLTSNAQRVFYDSLNNDTCKAMIIRGKEYCQCFDLFGRTRSSGYLKNGKRESYWKIYMDGFLLKEGNYTKGQRTGLWKEYYIDGQELFIGKYVNDKKNGEWLVYSSVFDLRVKVDKRLMILKEKRKYTNGILLNMTMIEK